jgi:hypothetical protein
MLRRKAKKLSKYNILLSENVCYNQTQELESFPVKYKLNKISIKLIIINLSK